MVLWLLQIAKLDEPDNNVVHVIRTQLPANQEWINYYLCLLFISSVLTTKPYLEKLSLSFTHTW